MRSLPGGCPCVRLDDVEARGCQLVAEITCRPLVCRDDRMIELLDDVAIEEADQQGASRAEYSTEFQERSADRVGLVVDQRVPSGHTRDELAILEALVRAIDRRDEVFQVIDDAENVD